MILVKTNIAGFAKDKKSGAIVNTDKTQFERIKEQRRLFKEHKNLGTRLAALEKRVAELEAIANLV